MKLLAQWADVRPGTTVVLDDDTVHYVSTIHLGEPMADGRPGQMRVSLDTETRSVWPTSEVWVVLDDVEVDR